MDKCLSSWCSWIVSPLDVLWANKLKWLIDWLIYRNFWRVWKTREQTTDKEAYSDTVSKFTSTMTTEQDSTLEDPLETTAEVSHQTTGSSMTSSTSRGTAFYFQCAVLDWPGLTQTDWDWPGLCWTDLDGPGLTWNDPDWPSWTDLGGPGLSRLSWTDLERLSISSALY